MINVGTQRDTSRAAVELAGEILREQRRAGNPGVFAAIGLHPVHTSHSFHDEAELGGGDAAVAFTSRGEAFDIEHYRSLALHKKTVAIGECGLDYFHLDEDEDEGESAGTAATAAEPREEQIRKQKEAFIAQIELSLEVNKPLMIHCRDGKGADADTFADAIEILKFYIKKI